MLFTSKNGKFFITIKKKTTKLRIKTKIRTKSQLLKREEYLKYREITRVLVHARLLHYQQIFLKYNHDLKYNRVAIRDQRSRWGSCSSRGNLNFNYRLAKLPMHLVDYVIVHELSHLKHMNHSVDFWNLVGIACPDYDKCRHELKSTVLKI